jgi:hypothetical protein
MTPGLCLAIPSGANQLGVKQMPATEHELKLQMRLYAVELLAAKMLAMSLLLQPEPDPSRRMAKIRQQMVHPAQPHTFPDLDPAMSDLLSAELEAAVDRLMEMATVQIDQALQARKKKTERGA